MMLVRGNLYIQDHMVSIAFQVYLASKNLPMNLRGLGLQDNGQQSIHLYIVRPVQNERILGIRLCGSHILCNVCIKDDKAAIFFYPLAVLIFLEHLVTPIHRNIHPDKIHLV